MKVNKKPTPDTHTGKFIHYLRGVVASTFALGFLITLIAGIVSAIGSLLVAGLVLVLLVGAVLILLGLPALVLFSFMTSISPHEYEMEFEGMNDLE